MSSRASEMAQQVGTLASKPSGPEPTWWKKGPLCSADSDSINNKSLSQLSGVNAEDQRSGAASHWRVLTSTNAQIKAAIRSSDRTSDCFRPHCASDCWLRLLLTSDYI